MKFFLGQKSTYKSSLSLQSLTSTIESIKIPAKTVVKMRLVKACKDVVVSGKKK